ncbi:MAG: MBL fold metallo-hydrolase [Cyanobacteria bacterium]|nr:MBL fold metallo-hydrolase [Cyanobacteriota bacterium]
MTELTCFPYGVGHGEEGVCLQLQIGPHRVLLDCGLASLDPLQGETAERSPAEPPPGLIAEPPADLVICTHAHPDHARGLIGFHRRWPQIPIFASSATVALLPLNWPGQSVPAHPNFGQSLPWRQAVEIAPDLTLTLWPAGHLPGAACCLLVYTTPKRRYTVFYTGDFLLSNARLVEGLPLNELRGLKPDVLIVEGSHGTARHPHRRQQENRLADQINQAIATGYNVLLPVPVLGLGQDLVMLLRSHHHFTGKDLTVWVDPWVAEGCDAYLKLLPHLPSTVQNFARHQSLFWDERVLPRARQLPADQPWDEGENPAIVIGYQNADLATYIHRGDRPWRILLPEPLAAKVAAAGFAPADAPRENPTLDWLQTLDPELAEGWANIETYLLTTHCDGPGTTQLIHNLRPQHVLLVHGAPNYLADLANLEDLQSRYKIHIPSAGQPVALSIGETFIQPAAPDMVFEGELTPTDTGLLLDLPDAIQQDPRWANLTDSGIVQLRWQGDDLVVRGISQKTLLRRGVSPAIALSTSLDCCFRCIYWRQRYCSNPKSPLFGFHVAAEGYCPAFQAKTYPSKAAESGP